MTSLLGDVDAAALTVSWPRRLVSSCATTATEVNTTDEGCRLRLGPATSSRTSGTARSGFGHRSAPQDWFLTDRLTPQVLCRPNQRGVHEVVSAPHSSAAFRQQGRRGRRHRVRAAAVRRPAAPGPGLAAARGSLPQPATCNLQPAQHGRTTLPPPGPDRPPDPPSQCPALRQVVGAEVGRGAVQAASMIAINRVLAALLAGGPTNPRGGLQRTRFRRRVPPRAPVARRRRSIPRADRRRSCCTPRPHQRGQRGAEALRLTRTAPSCPGLHSSPAMRTAPTAPNQASPAPPTTTLRHAWTEPTGMGTSSW